MYVENIFFFFKEKRERLNQVCVCVYVSPGQPLNIKCLALSSPRQPQQPQQLFFFFSLYI